MREKWKEQIESLQKFVASYTKLLQKLQAPYFDDDDRKRVEERIATFQKALDHAQMTFDQRERVYNTDVKQLQAVLEKRQSLLEEADEDTHIFELDKELLEFFVQRQQGLQNQMQEVLQKLDELPTA